MDHLYILFFRRWNILLWIRDTCRKADDHQQTDSKDETEPLKTRDASDAEKGGDKDDNQAENGIAGKRPDAHVT